MSSASAPYYADDLSQVDGPLLLNEPVAEATYRLRVAAPPIAQRFRPGQFVMLRMHGVDSPLIGRALAIYDSAPGPDGRPETIDLIYLRKGALTVPLSDAPVGTMVSLWGPLGNGFATRPCQTLVLAVGGIGQTPMLVAGREALRRGWAERVELVFGARRASLLAGLDDFRDAGFQVTACTDDGSLGQQALVPDVVAERLDQLARPATGDPGQPKEPGQPVETAREASQSDRVACRVITCGPEIMMEKVSEVCRQRGIDCQVSMETPMACGIGICFSCVAKVQQGDGTWDYKRTCVEGPVFDAEKICWS